MRFLQLRLTPLDSSDPKVSSPLSRIWIGDYSRQMNITILWKSGWQVILKSSPWGAPKKVFLFKIDVATNFQKLPSSDKHIRNSFSYNYLFLRIHTSLFYLNYIEIHITRYNKNCIIIKSWWGIQVFWYLMRKRCIRVKLSSWAIFKIFVKYIFLNLIVFFYLFRHIKRCYVQINTFNNLVVEFDFH